MKKLVLGLGLVFLMTGLVRAESVRVEKKVEVHTGNQVQSSGGIVVTEEAKAEARGEYLENIKKAREEYQAKQMEWREQWEARKAEVIAGWQERRADVAGKHAERLARRFAFYYERLKAIIGKFGERLVKMGEEGKEVGPVEDKLEEAGVVLEEGKKLGEQAVAAFTAIDPAKYEEQREEALAARDLATAAREKFRETVRLLREAWRMARALG